MGSYTLVFKERKIVADRTHLFTFVRPEGFLFEAGQYVVLKLSKLVAPDERGPVRSFSICSAPFEDDIFFAMREGETGFKKTFYDLQPGDSITATGPIGHFTLAHAADALPIVFLVGGIGITPVRSLLKQAEHDGSLREFVVFFGNRFRKDAAFHDEIKNLKLKNLRYVTALSQETTPCAPENDERGYICEPMIRKYVPDITGVWFYIVGAPAFTEAMEEMLTSLGIAKERQVSDPFAGLVSEKNKH